MTETTMRVGLKELTALRIACSQPDCGGTVEIPIDKLPSISAAVSCPVCREPFLGDMPNTNALSDFGRALSRLNNFGFSVEFPVKTTATQ